MHAATMIGIVLSIVAVIVFAQTTHATVYSIAYLFSRMATKRQANKNLRNSGQEAKAQAYIATLKP